MGDAGKTYERGRSGRRRIEDQERGEKKQKTDQIIPSQNPQ